MRYFLTVLICSLGWALSSVAQDKIATPAKQAFLVDFDTGAVLYAKEADKPMPPASMSKLMTVYMVFEAIKNNNLGLDDKFAVSRKAWQMAGSKMFVKVDTDVSVRELLNGIIVLSGNDACVVVAEGMAGTEEEFANWMTEKAHKLGLTHSQFRNASGWPDPEHYMSARDLAKLAAILIREFPELYKLFAVKEYTYSDIRQPNRNPLLFKKVGADGLKTGHTQAAGFGLVASAKQRDRRLIMVLNGMASATQRANESARLLNIGFRQYSNVDLFKAGEKVETAKVWLGDADEVPLVAEGDLKVTLPRAGKKKIKFFVEYEGPIKAPIRKGQHVANLRVEAPNMSDLVIPLVAGRDVAKASVFSQIFPKLWHLVARHL